MNRTLRTFIVVVVALGMAGLASFAVYRAVQRIPVREVEVAHVQAVVASTGIPVGTLLTKEQLKLVGWPSSSPVPGAFTSIDAVVGRAAVVTLAENEPITESKLASRGSGSGLPPTIPPGMRAMSVRVNEVIGVAGFVVPGTRVDVIATVDVNRDIVTRTVVSNLLVLAAGTRYDQDAPKKDGKPIPTTVVTLAVTPPDAERVSLAATEGKVMLALRNPLDTQPTETAGIRLVNLTGAPAGPPIEQKVRGIKRVVAALPPAPPPPPPRPYTVETIRGAKRTTEEVKK
ncbi:MAG: Flp pilus assembly protein CpaB [Acidobacteria bacterium]|nr:Flp pilus assembly protein CpaB [Acidobacteriota bacterium]